MLPRVLALLWVLLFVGGLWTAIIVVMMALFLIRPRKMTDARALLELRRLSPEDVGLEFEETPFDVVDQQSGKKLKIAAWWIPNEASRGKCAVIVHGYSDAKVGAIAWAPLLRSLGFAILAVDLRAHGESGGIYCTAGFWERHDLNQVIDQIKLIRPGQTQQVILFGISMGAAVVAAAAALRDDLAAIILEGPYADFTAAASMQALRLGMPGPLFQRMAYAVAQWIGQCDFAAVRPVDLIPKITCPLMVVEGTNDPFLSPDDMTGIRQAVESRSEAQSPSVFWLQDGVHHVVGLCDDPDAYHQRMEDFLARALPITPVVCDK
jgi:hypothetical protein